MKAKNKVIVVTGGGGGLGQALVLPHLLQRSEAHIVNVSSLGGPGQTIYGASKAALKLLTEGLYAELKGTPVKVTIIHPGAMQTKIMSNSGLKTSIDEAKVPKNAMMLSPDAAAKKYGI